TRTRCPGGPDFGSVEADAGRFDDNIDTFESPCDPIRPEGIFDAVTETVRCLPLDSIVQHQQRQARMALPQESDRSPSLATEPPHGNALCPDVSRTHRALPCRMPEPGAGA